MSNIINVIFRLRQKVEPETVYVWCVNGTWSTSYEHESFGIADICLPEGRNKMTKRYKLQAHATEKLII